MTDLQLLDCMIEAGWVLESTLPDDVYVALQEWRWGYNQADAHGRDFDRELPLPF